MEVFADQNFIMTNDQYSSGVAVEEYKGTYSLISSYMSNSEEVKKKWGYTIKNDKADKMLPWKIELGERKQAIEVLQGLLRLLNAEPEGPMELPEHGREPGSDDGQGVDEIPF